MSDHENDVDLRLAELGKQTENLGPRPGFEARVLASLPRRAPSFAQDLLKSSRWFLPLAACLAIFSLGWAAYSSRTLDESLAAAYGEEDLSW